MSFSVHHVDFLHVIAGKNDLAPIVRRKSTWCAENDIQTGAQTHCAPIMSFSAHHVDFLHVIAGKK